MEGKDIELREPKKDCFAYCYRGYKYDCSALNKMYCMNEDCNFYKPKNEVAWAFRGENQNGD